MLYWHPLGSIWHYLEDPGVDTFTYLCMLAYLSVCHDIFLCVCHMLNWLQCKKAVKTAMKLIRDRGLFIIKCGFNTHTQITLVTLSLILDHLNSRKCSESPTKKSRSVARSFDQSSWSCRGKRSTLHVACVKMLILCAGNRDQSNANKQRPQNGRSQLGSPLSKGQAWGKSWIDLLRVREGWAGHVSLFLGEWQHDSKDW